MHLKPAAIALFLIAFPGCGDLPGQGPSTNEISQTQPENQTADQVQSFALIDLNAEVVQVLGTHRHTVFGGDLATATGSPNTQRIGVGDQLFVRIWENTPQGLFSTPENRSTEIAVVVSERGTIYLPYVGALNVKGFTVDAARNRIAEAFEGKAVDPDVTVTLGDNGAQNVSVVGDANGPGRFAIPPSGLRLLDAVAAAGGAKESSFDTQVSVVRSGRTASGRLDDVVSNDASNIWLTARDTVQLLYQPRSFTALGAVGERKQQAFSSNRVSLAEAIAQSGGLSDALADKGGVFLFRFEPARQLYAAGWTTPTRSYAQGIPTIYRLDMSTPQAFFLAQSFNLRDKDVLYVSNAPAAEFRKFVDFVVGPFLTGSVQTKTLTE